MLPLGDLLPQVVVPTCYCSGRDACGSGVYDRNSWAETAESRERLKALDDDALVVNGYGEKREQHVVSFADGRRYLDDLRSDPRAPLVPRDAAPSRVFLDQKTRK